MPTQDAEQPEQLCQCPSQSHHEVQAAEAAPFSAAVVEAVRLPVAVEQAVTAAAEAVQGAAAAVEEVLAAAGEAVDWWKLAAAV